jgi:alpha-ketoglutarate-dependent taurine dioxygenase
MPVPAVPLAPQAAQPRHMVVHAAGRRLPDFISTERPTLQSHLHSVGAVLLRGFSGVDRTSFEDAVRCFAPRLMQENGEHVPVDGMASVYTPVPYAAEQKLLWHNENSFNAEWPHLIAFCATVPASTGGETLLVDSRAMLDRLDSPLVDEFRAKGLCYTRTMGLGVGRDWRQVFRTDDRRAVEDRCRREQCEFSWLDDDVLQTRSVRPAVVVHPHTGERCWFNQVPHWHPWFLEPELRAEFLDLFGEHKLPRDCTFGDGTPIPDAAAAAIAAAYTSLEWPVAWEPGDILFVDNVALAHGRNPYSGPRGLLVAMGQ